MSNRDIILSLIRSIPGLTDAEIRTRTGITPHQQVNQICRRLAETGLTERKQGVHGHIVNVPTGALPDPVVTLGPTEISASRSPNQPSRGLRPFVPTEESLDLLATLAPAQTLVILACSKSKCKKTVLADGQSALAVLPRTLSERLRDARRVVAARAHVDEATLMPAWQRYRGTFFQCARDQLRKCVAQEAPILILSGGYGVLLPTEPIGTYEAVFKLGWWPQGLIQTCLIAYAQACGVSAVVAFLSSSTDYATVVRSTPWRRANIANVLLMTPDLGRGRGAQVKVPRASAQAFSAFWQQDLHADWQSSNGLRLNVERLV